MFSNEYCATSKCLMQVRIAPENQVIMTKPRSKFSVVGQRIDRPRAALVTCTHVVVCTVLKPKVAAL